MKNRFFTQLLCALSLLLSWNMVNAQTCEITCPADITASAEASVCGANLTIPLPTLSGTCAPVVAGVTDFSVTQDLNFNAGGDLIATTVTATGVPTSSFGDVQITGNWNTDNGFATEAAAFSVEGVVLGNLPTGGGDCTANNFTYTLSQADYNTVAADGQLDFLVGADPDVDLFCVTNNITINFAVGTSSLPFANDFNGMMNASGFYPVGTTTVCYDTDAGNVQCCFDVTVIDDQGPIFMNCPKDQTISLDPGACEFIFNFEPVAMDNCPAMPINFELGPQTVTQEVNCNIGNVSTGTQHFRTFTLPATGTPLNLTNVTIGVDLNNAGGMITANVYTTDAPFPGGTLTLIATGSAMSTGAAAPSFLSIPVTASAMAQPGDMLVFEIVVPDGIVFFPGYGGGAANQPTWLQAAACGAAVPTLVTSIGIANGLVLNFDAAPLGVDIVQTAGPASGTGLPIGTTSFRYEATDGSGNTSICAFDIIVEEFPNVRNSLSCNDGVQISVDENCVAVVGADDILEGGPYGCYDSRYEVIIDFNRDGTFAPGEGNTVGSANIGQSYNVQVRDLVTGNACWGSILVEDKLIPELECEDLTLKCNADLTPGAPFSSSTSAAITPGDTWASVGGFDNDIDVAGVPSSAVITDVNVEVDITHTFVGDLVITVTSPNGISVTIDNRECGGQDNIDATFDDEGVAIVCNPNPAISGNVIPSEALSAFDGQPAGGVWTVTVGDNIGGDGGTINRLALIIEFDATNDFPVGGATVTPNGDGTFNVAGFDGCGDATLSFEDDTDDTRCGTDVLRRTWTIVDGAGNTNTCVQTINLERTTLADVVLPPNYDGIDQPALLCENRCGDAAEVADTRGCGPDNLYWAVLANGSPDPDASKTWPCGVTKCFGTGRPTGIACGDITATYTDVRANICTSGPSAGCFKILRIWEVIDWCTSERLTHVQILKIEDNEGPQLMDLEDLTISVDVWRCEADWFATEPWIMDNCSDIIASPLEYTVTIAGEEVVIRNGRYLAKDLAPGVYTVVYTAEDCCGNVGEQTIELTVVDDVAPVAVCDARTVVNLTATNNIDDDNLGTTKIFASTFDDGSFDNCSPEIWFKALRMNQFDSNGNGKGGEHVLDGDYAAIDCDGADGDDDVRPFPPRAALSAPLGVAFESGREFNESQAYFDDFVKFCCDDIDNGPIMVVFRVFDVDPTPFEFRNVFPASLPQYAPWYAVNPHKDAADYTGVIGEAMSPTDYPVRGAGPGPLYGRFGECMVEVEVQDKLPPFVVAPPNVVVTCDFWFEFDANNAQDFTDELDAVFGKVVEGTADPADRDSIVVRDVVCPAHPRFAEFAPASPFDDPCYDDQYDIFWGFDGYVLDNCNIDLEQTVRANLTCGQGTITRTWRAADAQGNWSNVVSQVITIINCKEIYVPTLCWRFTTRDIGSCDRVGAEFLRKLIEWPCDVELSRCQGPIDAFQPDNLMVTFDQDRRPRFDDDNCSLVTSTFTDETFIFQDSSCLKIFRNWVVIDWCLFDQGITPNRWEFTQVIKLLNTEGPKFADCTDKTFCGFGNPNNPNADQCVGEVTLDPGISDDCTPLDELRIDFKLDAFNDGNFDILGFSTTYPNGYPFPNPNGLPVISFDAGNPAYTEFLPVGTHRILWGAEDGCGNASVCEFLFTIEDCKPPSAICLSGISTIPMPDIAGGFIDLSADHFDLQSFDNCTDQPNLIFAFSDNPNDRVIRRFCADVTGLPEQLTVYVFDEAGNYATCEVGLLLTPCSGNNPSVAGTILTEVDEGVEDVMVSLGGYMTDQYMTGPNGFFQFLDLPENQNYVIDPAKDVDPMNGVSTFDLVLISKHILGETLNSPYKMIAADVNNTGSITVLDVVDIRKLILFINDGFPDNESWRFVREDFIFPDPSNPFASTFPEVFDINGLSTNAVVDFVAIKIGDVNESAVANVDGRRAQGRKSGALQFEVADEMLAVGAERTINFTAKDFANIEGYQFTLNFDRKAVEVVSTSAGELTGLSVANFGTSLLSNGALTTSWNASQGVSLSDDAVVFSVTVKAKQAIALSEVLSISSDYTVAEAYNAGQVMNVELNFAGASTAAEFALYQNQPNPFKNETLIGFVLPQSERAVVKIYDVAGKELKSIEGNYEAGYNEISVNRSELAGTGVLYYTLSTKTQSATKKMIILE